MRSKQQPRPSYRWLNKTSDENDEDENALEKSEENVAEKIDENHLGQNSNEDCSNNLINDPPIKQSSILLPQVQNSPPISEIMLSDNDTQTSPILNLRNHLEINSECKNRLNHSRSPSRTPPIRLQLQKEKNLIKSSSIESHDDVEHRIPATLIQDPNNTDREMSSPRCLSRDSSTGRSPSEDSVYSNRNLQLGSNVESPVGITLPATLPPAAAAALLPPQSAAMAAYLGVAAAAAAQQNRLLLSGALPGANLTKPPVSPSLIPLTSPLDSDSSVLDFSTKRNNKPESNDEENSDSDVVNLSKSDASGPLDLSVGNRKRSTEESPTPIHIRKLPRTMDYKTPVVSPWITPITPYVNAITNLSPKNPSLNDWNGKNKISSTQNDATKALEKMSELSRLGGEDLYKTSSSAISTGNSGGGGNSSVGSSGGVSSGSAGRHSAWQSHWLNKGADSTKDVLKCVWCKQSFPTLAAMSTHMKETKHCNVSVPPSSNMISSQNSGSASNSNSQTHNSSNNREISSSVSSKPSPSELNLLIKETMPLPRKLVRGQDVWLGKGAEQTRQILKCMWCGQSFRTLAEMTSHMQQTQHYTNIISQEQIISWKSADGGGGSNNGNQNASGGIQGGGGGGSSSTVSAVFTCKVCDQSFNSLKDLSNHMVKNSHYKEHIMRSITESGGRRRQTREKRKKSLPVRKLLELERAQHDFKNGDTSSIKVSEQMGPRITCEKCGDKIETMVFVEHIRQCVGGTILSQKNLLKSALTSNNLISSDSSGHITPNSRDSRKSISEEMTSPISRHISPSNPTDLSSNNSKETFGGNLINNEKSSSPSVLNAIEQLIEKSFDTKSRHPGYGGINQSNAPLGSSILKRLGIDESVDYTKPLIDSQTMNIFRSYQQHQSGQSYERRERSGSESSSVSDRGSSRLDSLTPERKIDHLSQTTTPRTTPDKIEHNELNKSDEGNHDEVIRIKKEPIDEDNACEDDAPIQPSNLSIKAEPIDDDNRPLSRQGSTLSNHNEDRRNSRASTPARSPRRTPILPSPTPSPASERSITPRSSSGMIDGKKSTSIASSLNALSSMYDSLTGNNASNAGGTDGHGNHQKKQTSHPLAALQKLCDKTETNQQNARTNCITTPTSSSISTASSPVTNTISSNTNTSNSMVGFNWAATETAVSPDSIMKCAFCDTPFISKAAYRHHLAKMHFVKDDVIPDPIQVKSQKQLTSPTLQSPKTKNDRDSVTPSGNDRVRDNSSSNNGQPNSTPPPPPPSSSSSTNVSTTAVSLTTSSSTSSTSSSSTSSTTLATVAFEESPHSKFLKYTELAKQLSSKYV